MNKISITRASSFRRYSGLFRVLGALGTAAAITGPLAHAEATRVTNPNSVNIEIFGRGMRYGIGYDRVLNDDLAVGFALGSAPMNYDDDQDAVVTAGLASPYINYYFTRDQGSLYITAGAALVTDTGDVKGKKTALGGLKLSGNGIVPQAGLGYENRGESGFLFRLAFYAMADRNVVPWLGFTLGYAF